MVALRVRFDLPAHDAGTELMLTHSDLPDSETAERQVDPSEATAPERKAGEKTMPKFVFAYHGAKKPDTSEEGEKVLTAWNAWSGVANPLSGLTQVEATDIDAAVARAKGCPILTDGGSVEGAEVLQMYPTRRGPRSRRLTTVSAAWQAPCRTPGARVY